MLKIFVSGGRGFLGKSVVEELKKIYGMENIIYPSSRELNLLDLQQLDDYFKKTKFDIVIHLAAKVAGIGDLTNHPLLYLEDNMIINYNIVKISLKYNIKKFITLGSSCGYNNETPLPMMEEEFWNRKPENTYGICKLLLLEHLKAQDVMQWVYLVPANIYGPGDHFGEANAHLIPATVLKFEQAVKNDSDYIDVWGDGTQVRDFIYIDDVVNIMCKSIENMAYQNKAINISTNIGCSVKEIVNSIKEIMGLSDMEVRWDSSKPTGILKKILSNKKFIGIENDYRFVDINEGLQKTIKWYYVNKDKF